MRIDELKKSIWGYKVSDVCQYLSAVESRHAERIAELQEQAAQAEEQAQKRIGELEAELCALRRENEALLEKRQLTFDTLLAAQAYARQAREETRQHEEEARQKVADEAGRQMSELNDYAAKISKMRDDFRALLEELDGRTAAGAAGRSSGRSTAAAGRRGRACRNRICRHGVWRRDHF